MAREQAKFFWDDAWGPNPLGSGPTSSIQAAAPATPTATGATAETHTSPNHATPDLGIAQAGSITPTVFAHADLPVQWFAQADAPSQWFAHAGAPVQYVPVASVVTDLQALAVTRSDFGGASDTGGGDIARGLDLASLDLNLSSFADHGWFIVPSASSEYGQAYAAANDFAFDVAAGAFSSDWFWG